MSDFEHFKAFRAAYLKDNLTDVKNIARNIPSEDLTAVLLDRESFDTSEGFSYAQIIQSCINKSQTDLIAFFIDRGLDVNACVYPGLPLVCYACREKKAEVVLTLLAFGADPNSLDRKTGDSLLHIAAMHFDQPTSTPAAGQPEWNGWDIIESLFLAGASSAVRNEESKRPIDYIPEDMRQRFIQHLVRSYL